jgi:energy-coupling factor transporter ATP-binding protein EcfA2
MSVIGEIAAWANEQDDWISDAVRRLFAQEALSSQDVADLAALIKTSRGLEDPDKRVAVKLDPAAVSASEAPAADVSLTAIAAPRNINAIGSPDGITFEADGLTIVYGNNGAGKSGYARALKRACRARSNEAIVPNIFAPAKTPSPAAARLHWRAAGTDGSADWVDGAAAPSLLAKIGVFDTRCARVFVDDQAEVSYIPYGMDILRDLATGLQSVQRVLEAEAGAAKFDRRMLAPLEGDTVVGKLVDSLKPTTDPKVLKVLAELSDEEGEERTLLAKQLRDEDPAKQAATLRRFAARLQAIETELAALAEPLSDQHTGALKTAFEQLVAAEQASKIAASALQEGGKALPGTGTDPWEVLVRSAMAFASAEVYPGQQFPGSAEDASCVLCQQPLAEEARERLQNFVKFLETDAQKQFAEKRRRAAELYKAIVAVNLPAFPSDRTILEELSEFAPELVVAIKTYVTGLGARQSTVKASAPNRRVDALEALPPAPAEALKTLREKRVEQAAKLEKAMTPEQRKEKLARLAELDARQKLKEHLPAVLEGIAVLKLELALRESIKLCNTLTVTKKINELYDKTVTAELRSALTKELTELRLQNIKIGLEMSGQKGSRMQQLKFVTPAPYGRVKVSDVLSEGEQRAIAIASFLAEVSLEQSKSGIVFDDPVSSLDHARRELIARRLAAEARYRQVIVFTHDLSFAWSLRDFAQDLGVMHGERHVYAAGETKGHCSSTLPFEAKKLDARVNDLRALGARAKKTLEQEKDHDAYNDLARTCYRRMRDTWELLVEDQLFGGAVKRFRRAVNTLNLRRVSIEDEDVKSVYDGMTRCSYFTHEGGAEAPPALPTPDELIADIETLGNAVVAVKAKGDAAERRRTASGMSGYNSTTAA